MNLAFEFAPFICFGSVVAFVVVAAGLAYYMNLRRRKEVQETAQLMGFDWFDQAPALATAPFADFELFTRGHSHAVSNVMRGQIGGQNVLIFDYRYTTGSGKNRSSHSQTVVGIVGGGGKLPDFTLSPESFLDRILEAFGYQDLDFDEDPEFSKCFLLRGKDVERIREVFGPEVREHLLNHRGISVEKRGDSMIVYRWNRLCAPKLLPEFAAEAVRLCAFLNSSARP